MGMVLHTGKNEGGATILILNCENFRTETALVLTYYKHVFLVCILCIHNSRVSFKSDIIWISLCTKPNLPFFPPHILFLFPSVFPFPLLLFHLISFLSSLLFILKNFAKGLEIIPLSPLGGGLIRNFETLKLRNENILALNVNNTFF